MVELKIKIENCSQCPNREMKSFGHLEEWNCEVSGYKMIAIHDMMGDYPAIPEWCPLKPTAQKSKFEAFRERLVELCLKLKVELATSEYDSLQVWDLDGELPPVILEDKTKKD